MPPFRDRIARFAVRSRGTFALEMFALWAAVVLASLAFLPLDVFVPGTPLFLLVLGPLALWRWSWGGLHFARAVVFSRITYPRMARRARAVAPRANHVGVIVMSWRIDPQVHAAVMDGIVGDLADYGAPATLVLSASDPADAVGLEAALERHRASNVRAVVAYQAGKGKRHGMYEALHVLAATGAPRNGITLLMDGDTYVPRGTLARTAPILLADRRIGALTIDNIPLVAGSALTREWYRLRMAQRYVYMCSLALSRKVLVLTGRWSRLSVGELRDAFRPLASARSSPRHGSTIPASGGSRCSLGEDKVHLATSLPPAAGTRSSCRTSFICPYGGSFRRAASCRQPFPPHDPLVRQHGARRCAGARHRAAPARPVPPGSFSSTSALSMWTSLTAPLFFHCPSRPVFRLALPRASFVPLWGLPVAASRRACSSGRDLAALSRRLRVSYLLFYGSGGRRRWRSCSSSSIPRAALDAGIRQDRGRDAKGEVRIKGLCSPMSRVLLALQHRVCSLDGVVLFHAVGPLRPFPGAPCPPHSSEVLCRMRADPPAPRIARRRKACRRRRGARPGGSPSCGRSRSRCRGRR